MPRMCPSQQLAAMKSLRSRKSLKKLQLQMSVVSYLGIGIAPSVATTISIGEGFATAGLAPSRAVSPGMLALSPEIGTALVAI